MGGGGGGGGGAHPLLVAAARANSADNIALSPKIRCNVWLSVAPELAKSVRPTGRPHLGEHLPGLVGPLRHSFASSTTC
jgi:hypothetical protein